ALPSADDDRRARLCRDAEVDRPASGKPGAENASGPKLRQTAARLRGQSRADKFARQVPLTRERLHAVPHWRRGGPHLAEGGRRAAGRNAFRATSSFSSLGGNRREFG